jgi:predicted nucleic acid-binding protein
LSAPGGLVTLDTNVVVYAFDDRSLRAAVAREILRQVDFISVQVLNEFANVVSRKLGRDWAAVTWGVGRVRRAVEAVLPVTEDDNSTAIRLAERYRLSLYDSLVLAVALSGGAQTIYSQDMHHDLLIDGTLRIVDPFR